MYIAKKLTEFEKSDHYNEFYINKLIEILSMSILIPDTFSKKTYIDRIFKAIEENSDYGSLYKRTSESDGPVNLGTIGGDKKVLMQEEKTINIYMAIREYILYLSKIYLPLISACFYVLFAEKFNGMSNLYEVAKTYLLSEYKNRWKTINDEFRRPSLSTEKYLLQLYKAIYSNIYTRKGIDNKEHYSNIVNSLSTDMCSIESYIKSVFLHLMIRLKVSTNRIENITDPIPYEHSMEEPIGVADMLEMMKYLRF